MELSAKVTKHQFIDQYINIFNGGLKITPMEKKLLHEILHRYLTMKDDGLKEPYIGQLIFSQESMTNIRKKLSMTSQSVTNYKGQLKKKGIIREGELGLHVDPKMVPQKTIQFNFNIISE